MALQLLPLYCTFAVGVRASDRELENEAPDRNIRLEGPQDSHVAQGTTPRVLDALFTEEVVTAGGLHSVLVDVKADRANPSIVSQTLRGEVSEDLRPVEFFNARLCTAAESVSIAHLCCALHHNRTPLLCLFVLEEG